ncbi:3'(2'),5'-bisphosphate nucleotidase CysQ [Bacteroides ndongoniae]|uniref:3'(2'),5'-bisphosphate nucleotidase CysQ n=1 Tax=Bacteroides ndongoniae TaxID=1903262 RepID=UPI0008D90FEB|nr:3'(2'),5'-bisphosphate nucleotidase CysQ [Bacteroides ndongoniae]
MEQHYILNAIEAALRAGGQILSIYNDPSSDFQVERKADNSPLTIADRKAHETIVEILKDTPFPILSEEGKSLPFEMRNGWETLWIVDPLDGTKEFIKRNGEFTVNIALVLKGKPVMGVIYVPVKTVLYFAEDTLGAYKIEGIKDLDHKSLDDLISEAVRLPDKSISRTNFVMVASRSHLTPETEIYIDKMRAVHGDLELVSIGSSLKICLVAEGRADVYPRFAPTMEWDTAAGHAIASAAGMEVYQAETDLPLQYNKQDLLNPWFVVEKKHEREIK